MPTVKALNCPSCGAPVSGFIGNTNTCEYCGASLLFEDNAVKVEQPVAKPLRPEPVPELDSAAQTNLTSWGADLVGLIVPVMALIVVAVALGIGILVIYNIQNAIAP
jgi:hypothetical protein